MEGGGVEGGGVEGGGVEGVKFVKSCRYYERSFSNR